MLTISLWNSNGCGRHTIEAITNALPPTDLLFLTETWLLPPLKFLTNWKQYHTYAIPVDNSFRGEMGISLLVHPDCPHQVTHFPSSSPYVFSVQVSNLLIHCVYLPPALSVDEAIALGDHRTSTRGIALHSWVVENGLTYWNTELAYGIPTYNVHTRFSSLTGNHHQSVIDLFLSTQELHNAQLNVHDDLSLGSDHSPLTLSCLVPPPPLSPNHLRLLWNLRSGPLADTNSIVRRIRHNRVIQPQFSHPEGPRVAATVMARHLQQAFSGANLPDIRYSAPPIPNGPHPIDEASCPFSTSTVHHDLLKRLSRCKAPGVDHIRTEMLLPIVDEVVPVITLLSQLCWKLSVIPSDWRTAQVVPIYKKGDVLDSGNYRPISLTSIMRKLFELCLQAELESIAPPLDPVQGGFRHHRSAPDQALYIKSAYDTVDRAIVWRALDTHVSEPMLGILQCLFDQVSIQVLLGDYSSPSFWSRTGVLQGSILSPFLYSIYINTLPVALRDVRLPVSARYYSSTPQREFGGLWINCLLYADDVVLIAAPEVMPKLLMRAEEHSRSLGYRWNPAKSPIPKEPSFSYLGVPFSPQGKISTDLLIRRNTASAVSAMRTTLLPIGIRSASFSRLTASRLYSTFIRPKFEYGLCLCTFQVKQLALLEKSQDLCLRMAFGGHRTSSTGVYKHLVNLPSMKDHTTIINRNRFRWPALLKSNSIWSNPILTDGHASIADKLTYLSSPASIRRTVVAYRTQVLTSIYRKPNTSVFLSANDSLPAYHSPALFSRWSAW
ncbi:hypothetical protein G6F46_010860 [Rhizopus delemar]|uniref:Reverse transcriptase domain-containing protein n=2 Tax=Rhizopus TaxID=4842 RepID=A0A9P7CK54_9FUNG|nr:hypothetical protein G6F55_010006 [Rhizopus delemar]KAG1536770.1 hypothetical protein G6F51_010774 [Rhizopus arrhizus]KAG1493747.1 hypothetical protein G6F54_008362 [Rhizopus delemar]KAG1503975.1 hypothetical protein G6F53_010500 [Rhizopus delemar]KAG1544117.1 hypothetical protein G6F49_011160 [Rhizopus delemar]